MLGSSESGSLPEFVTAILLRTVFSIFIIQKCVILNVILLAIVDDAHGTDLSLTGGWK
jgi:hypothetical protein